MPLEKIKSLAWLSLCVALVPKQAIVTARTFEECAGITSGFTPNSLTSCIYDQIYCNGDQSMLCNATACNENFVCLEADPMQDENTSKAFIPECENQAPGFIRNPNTDCEYIWISCDGANSMLCDAAECNPDFQCPDPPTTVTTPSSSTGTTNTTPTGSTVVPPKFIECIGVSSGSFKYNSNANCPYPLIYCDGQNSMLCSEQICDPSYVCSSTTIPPPTTVHIRDQCRESDGLYPYPENPSYYYQCKNGYLILQDCPLGWRFNPATAKCEQSS